MAQAKAGDIAGARKTANLIQRADYKLEAQLSIVRAELDSGDIADAQATADQITEASSKVDAHTMNAAAKLGAGDIAGAKKALASAREIAGSIEHAYNRSRGAGIDRPSATECR